MARSSDDRLPAARKRFGQHFLRDAQVLDAIADALGDVSQSTVVEIGPGRGALTDRLVKRAARVVAIEVDRDLVRHLRARYAALDHVTIVEGDVLATPLASHVDGPFVLAGNVPYYITTPILFHALEAPRPSRAVYLVQREVAERMAAPPGSKTYGALSVNLQALATARTVRRVPPGAFQPPPAVDSAVVVVEPRATPVIDAGQETTYRRFVQAAFGLRRKQLVRVLRTVRGLESAEAERVIAACALEPTARPETLSPEDFARLVRALDASAHEPELPDQAAP
ncbi:MAG: 16S rRNA (adenine(1518)-N(6)/adenine(1519)-N(6))-dimethyltransferase RsmA [Gemmatimonadetes bacterium]|nr:16S rRNA (adenine(1518)-N(6)/adenine(1519)-N(6))-dimethyltransferase RsmA [Gemmatimonadota bacterium]